MKFFHKQKAFLKRNRRPSPALLFIIVGCLCAGIGIYFGLRHQKKNVTSLTHSSNHFLEGNTPENLPFDDIEEKAEETLAIHSQESSDLTEIFKTQETQPSRPFGIYHAPPAWLKQTHKWAKPIAKNKVNIIIDDIEFASPHGWYWISQFNIPLTFTISSPTPKVYPLIHKARKKNREILIYLPLQPTDPTITKPRHITQWLSPSFNKSMIESFLDKKLKHAPKTIGFTNYFPTSFWQPDKMEALLSHLNEREIVFVDAVQAPPSIAHIASIYNVPYLKRAITVYPKTPFTNNLKKLEKKLSQNHQLIIALKPHPTILKRFLPWVKKMQKKQNVSFVPLSVLFKQLKSIKKPPIVSSKKIRQYNPGMR